MILFDQNLIIYGWCQVILNIKYNFKDYPKFLSSKLAKIYYLKKNKKKLTRISKFKIQIRNIINDSVTVKKN